MKSSHAKIFLLICFGSFLAMIITISRPIILSNFEFARFSIFRLGFLGVALILFVLTGLVLIKGFKDERWLGIIIDRIIKAFQDTFDGLFERVEQKDDNNKSFKHTWYYDAILFLMVIIIFTPITFSMVTNNGSDIPTHLNYAQQMKVGFGSGVPLYIIAHSGWQLLVIFFQFITRSSFQSAGVQASMAGIILMAFVLYYWIKPTLIKKGISLWWGVFIALSLNLVTPLFFLELLDGKLYFGYLGMITYHNPTTILLRPFAILQLIFAVRSLDNTTSSRNQIIFAAIVSVLATFIKPIFAICILPVLGLIILYRLVKKQQINWKMLMLGLILPTAATLIWQFLLTYQSNIGKGIIFAPFEFMKLSSDYLILKFFVSIIFPLFVIAFYYRKAWRDTTLVVAWLTFLVSIFITYFMAESGKTFDHGNFARTSEISMLVLFCASTLFFIKQFKVNQIKVVILKYIWAAHIIFGIIYYIRCFITKSYY